MTRHLNLLPWTIRCRVLLRERLRQWYVVWGVTLAVVLGMCLWNGRQRSTAERELEMWRRRAEGIQTIATANTSLQQEIKQLQSRLAKYGQIANERNGMQLLATVSRSAGICENGLQVQKLTYRVQQIAVPLLAGKTNTKGQPPKMRTVHLLSLSGSGMNNLTIARFVSALRDAAVFESVELKSSQGKGELASGPRTYQVECRF